MKYLIIAFFAICFARVSLAGEAAVVRVSGEAEVRRGVDENWRNLNPGAPLELVDTILTGENGEIVLLLPDGRKFTLGPNSILDMADLQKVTDRELFLFLMKQKIGKLEKRNKPTPLRVGKVSLVHGSSKDEAARIFEENSADTLRNQLRFKNGVIALYNQGLYPNAIVKIHRSLSAALLSDNDPEVYYYLGESLASLKKNGQATDAFNRVIHLCKAGGMENSNWEKIARNSLEQISQK